MPTGPRIRGNNSFGVITDNPLTAGATTFNSIQLSTLPVVIAAHAVVTLDPIRQFGEPEIVIVTAHTALATVATITRGAYGTTARSHPQGTVWTHAPVTEDFISVRTSGTRPTDPYDGEFIYETDTKKLVGFSGVDWAPRDAGGQLDYAERTTTQGGITAITDLTGLLVAATVAANRRIKITGRALAVSTTATDVIRLWLTDGANNPLQIAESVSTALVDLHVPVILTPSPGPNTWKLRMSRQAGAGTVTMQAGPTFRAFIVVEDIGAA